MTHRASRLAIAVVGLAIMVSLGAWWLAFRCHQPYCPCSTEAKAVAAAGALASSEASSRYQTTDARAFDKGDEWRVLMHRRVVPGVTELQAPMSGNVWVSKRTCRSRWGLNR